MRVTVSRDIHRRSICWEVECPDCGYNNTAHIDDLRFLTGKYHGFGAFHCDECRGWFTLKFDLDYARKIRREAISGERG